MTTRTWRSRPGGPLLHTLGQAGIFIPSACGGRGTCAYCKVKVHEGGGPVLPTETPYLSPQEVTDHVRLSCQVKVRNDLKIEIPEEFFQVREYRVRVENLTDLTPGIKGVRLSILSPPDGITFKAGQYVQLEVPRYKLDQKAGIPRLFHRLAPLGTPGRRTFHHPDHGRGGGRLCP